MLSFWTTKVRALRAGRRCRRGYGFLALALMASVSVAGDPNVCDEPGDIPDVIVGDLYESARHGRVGDITAFSIGTTSCNVGTCQLNWDSDTADHPVIGQNMFRLKDGRFEQLGQSWVKHGFFALSETLCSTECISTAGGHLGVNCSDPYSASFNAFQFRLGPKHEINAATGEFPWPFTTIDEGGDAIYKRLQVKDEDLDPDLNVGARYFVEGQYIAADDAAAGRDDNNVSYRPASIASNNGFHVLSLEGETIREAAAIRAWGVEQAGVIETDVSVPDDGDLIVAVAVTELGGGVHHYEYAVQNLTSHRSVGEFSVPLPEGVTPTNVGFHDVDYHSGEPWDGTDWAFRVEQGKDGLRLIWETTPFDQDPNANALRWGTLYNFRFDAEVAPVVGEARLGLFRPGTPDETTVATMVPSGCDFDGICEPGENCSNCEADCVGEAEGSCCGDGVCSSDEDPCRCAVDCGGGPAVEAVCEDGADNDCDGLVDCEDPDCCGAATCDDGIDLDNDGVASCDCNDNDALVWGVPDEPEGLELSHSPASGTLVSWKPPSFAGAAVLRYDVIRSDSRADFAFGVSCLVSDDPSTSLSEFEDPPSGTAFYYLVRAENDCPAGNGSLGQSSDDEPRAGRDCP